MESWKKKFSECIYKRERTFKGLIIPYFVIKYLPRFWRFKWIHFIFFSFFFFHSEMVQRLFVMRSWGRSFEEKISPARGRYFIVMEIYYTVFPSYIWLKPWTRLRSSHLTKWVRKRSAVIFSYFILTIKTVIWFFVCC